jgi:hypothetical protein
MREPKIPISLLVSTWVSSPISVYISSFCWQNKINKAKYWSKLMTNILDEHVPRCKMSVRERDVTYMTTAWKRGIRTTRRAAQNYEKCKTTEKLELKRKLRNEATRQRRKAIKDCWLNLKH